MWLLNDFSEDEVKIIENKKCDMFFNDLKEIDTSNFMDENKELPIQDKELSNYVDDKEMEEISNDKELVQSLKLGIKEVKNGEYIILKK